MKVDLLGSDERVRFQRQGGGLRATLPESARRGPVPTFELTGVKQLRGRRPG